MGKKKISAKKLLRQTDKIAGVLLRATSISVLTAPDLKAAKVFQIVVGRIMAQAHKIQKIVNIKTNDTVADIEKKVGLKLFDISEECKDCSDKKEKSEDKKSSVEVKVIKAGSIEDALKFIEKDIKSRKNGKGN